MSLLKLRMTLYTGNFPHDALASGKRPRGGFMDRRCTGYLFFILAIISLATLSGCVGNSTNNSQAGGVQTVALSPSTDVSLELGRTQNFGASARNAAGQSVFTTIHFVSDNNASLTIANSGAACAGSWDSLSNPVVCTPGVAGIATVTAEAEGVSSAPTTVYVHQHIQSVNITPIGTPQCSKPPCTCF